MSGKKICCMITLILFGLMCINLFLPVASNGYESISVFDYLTLAGDSDGGAVVWIIFLICLAFLIFGIVTCILCLCNVTKDYKYALSAVPVPMITYFFIFFLFCFLATSENVHMSIGIILGVLLPIAITVLVFVGNALKDKFVSYNNNLNNTIIKGYDRMTGKPIYATFRGYNTITGEPIYD